jgi:SsrA-binding protein
MRGAVKTVATNRKAYHDYHIEDRYEAGIVLTGTEIKSIRAGRVNLRDSYARIVDGEVWLVGAHIAPYEQGSRYNHPPKRDRKLLLRKREIARLQGKLETRGYTLVPLRMYLKGSWAKVELALARGKRQYDKRAAIAKREADREVQRALRDRG